MFGAQGSGAFIEGCSEFDGASVVGGLAQSFGLSRRGRCREPRCAATRPRRCHASPPPTPKKTVTFAGSPDRAKSFGIFRVASRRRRRRGGSSSAGVADAQALSCGWCLYGNLLDRGATALAACGGCCRTTGRRGVRGSRDCPRRADDGGGGLFACLRVLEPATHPGRRTVNGHRARVSVVMLV